MAFPVYLYFSDEYKKESAKASAKAWQKKNPEKVKAHQIVREAIKDGTLQMKPCQRCGDWPVQAHHPDYSQPLNVWWLCPKCHARITKLTKEYIYVEKSSGI